jgi:hypothetical protein
VPQASQASQARQASQASQSGEIDDDDVATRHIAILGIAAGVIAIAPAVAILDRPIVHG